MVILTILLVIVAMIAFTLLMGGLAFIIAYADLIIGALIIGLIAKKLFLKKKEE